jgi:hypothetical protein
MWNVEQGMMNEEGKRRTPALRHSIFLVHHSLFLFLFQLQPYGIKARATRPGGYLRMKGKVPRKALIFPPIRSGAMHSNARLRLKGRGPCYPTPLTRYA